MSPYLAMCLNACAGGAALALMYQFYGPVAVVTVLVQAGVFDVS